jgi:5'(3')-deoxyribonucleotidase
VKPVVLFDLDGVLADFTGSAVRLHGLRDANLQSWDWWIRCGLSDEEFWQPIRNPDFWANLEPLADGMDMFDRVATVTDRHRVGILTSAQIPGATDGKRAWVKRHLPGFEDNLLTGTAKHLLAAPNKVLVDDSDKNVVAFVGQGGKAVLVPRPWNAYRRRVRPDGSFCVMTAMTQLRDLLGRIGA